MTKTELCEKYGIVTENGAIDRIEQYIPLDKNVLIVTDSGVPKEYSQKIFEKCVNAHIVTLPQGEESKSLKNFELLLKKMVEYGFDRTDRVIAVGGGVVGDLSGFAASCYMRGIDFYNVPTTLLSQVDSSVGGKTAIDFEGVKNIVGAFYPPKKVVIDPILLKTLDRRQFFAGLAECIKMAATSDKELFEMIENSNDIKKDIFEIIIRSLAIKLDVVEKDPKEKSLRRVLNFGHTVGHAIESYFGGTLLHGECVALGMLPMSGDAARARIRNVLKKYGLPQTVECTPDDLRPYLMLDKKKQGDTVKAVRVEQIGSFEITDMAPEQIIKNTEILK